MGAYKYIREAFEKQYKERGQDYRNKLIQWRTEGAIVRVERPINVARARTLGYKAKIGYVVVRIRVDKGRRRRRTPMGGRKARHNYLLVQPDLSHQAIGEQRVNRRFPNLEVLNSYWVGEDGTHKYFEVIMVDSSKNGISSMAKQVASRKKRVYRGLTAQGRKARALL
ncbi:50S ribosomal protein L15e [Candidatus Micrarchaeota archaeon]|nr:50S ribosomal protein L15e [Candidatus Micrarchaeota archaeon]